MTDFDLMQKSYMHRPHIPKGGYDLKSVEIITPSSHPSIKTFKIGSNDENWLMLPKKDKRQLEELAKSRIGVPLTQEEKDAKLARSKAQVAKQRAEPVHSVFRRGNKIVAIVTEGGGVTSINALGRIDNTGTTEEIVKRVYDRFSKIYGNVQKDTYSADSGITKGMAQDEMFGQGPRIPSPAEVSRLSKGLTPLFKQTTDTLEMFHEALEKFYRR